TTFFDVRPPTFHLQTPLARCTTRLAGLARFGKYEGSQDHIPKLFKAVFPVAFLVSIPLRSYDHLTVCGNAVSLLNEKAGLNVIRKILALCHVPAEHGFRSHLVDILAPRTAGANEAPMKLWGRHSKRSDDFYHC